MKRPLLALAALLLVSQVSLAQTPAPGGSRFMPIDRMATELGLDDAQKAELKRVMEELRARHETEMDQAVRSVLTAEQFEKFKKLQEERRQRGPVGVR